jgi:hypothetical protein
MANTRYAIFPSIGIARLGNAPDEFYIGPETYRGLPILPGDESKRFEPRNFRDAAGRLCRQAARFRIIRDTAAGPEEVTLDHTDVKEIRWTVHLANKKASWYQFRTTSGEQGYPPSHPLRNADKVTPEERVGLLIDAGPREIAGRSQGSSDHPVAFSRDTIPPNYKGGNFPPVTLKPFAIDTLGSLKTDGQGRLLVLGGHGHSGSIDDDPSLPTYANNDGWWDDTSDGFVGATIVLASGERIDAEPAWVIVAPPKFAPELANLVSLYDTIFDVAVRLLGARPDVYENGLWKKGANGFQPAFETDIRPIFERALGYTWVAAIPPKPHTFDFDKLANTDPALNEFRRFYLDAIRPPDGENVIVKPSSGVTMMPYLAGDDALGASDLAGAAQATSKYLRLTDTQYFMLQQWADGHFDSGTRDESHPGDRLTRAVLENCVGGAFSPGIEMTWISRNPLIYKSPFRLNTRRDLPGPLSLGCDLAAGLEPGDVTRYMALPWQADFNECSSQPITGRTLWWWPAQRPEFVYVPVPLSRATPGAEHATIDVQTTWVGTDYDQNAGDYISFADNVQMVMSWDKLGFVYNVGTIAQPRFIEVERVLPRPTPAVQRT